MKRFLKLGLIVFVITVISLFVLTACNYNTTVGEELITNGGFEITEEGSSGTLISGWTRGSKDSTFSKSEISLSQSASDGRDDLGEKTLKIQNTEGTATYVYQSVKVDKNKAYKITYQVKVPSAIKVGGSDYAKGAYVTFLENTDYVLGEITNATDGWTEVTLYVSPKNTDYLTICLKLGEETDLAKGTVYFDNVSMKRVDTVPASATVVEISREKVVRYSENASGIAFVVCLTLLTVALAVAAYVLIRRVYGNRTGLNDFGQTVVKTEKEKLTFKKVATHPIAIAVYLAISTLLIRFILLFTTYGFGVSMTKLITVARATETVAPQNIFAYLTKYSYDSYTPGQLYLIYVFGGMGRALNDASLSMWLRVPSILADIAVVLAIYFYGKKYVGNKISTVYAGLYALLPIVFVMSSSKGSFESVLVALVLIAFLLLIEKKYIASYATFALSVLFDMRALAVVLLAMCYLVYMYYRADSTLKSFNAVRAKIIFGFVGAFVSFVLLSLPFTIGVEGKPLYVFEYYKNIMANNLSFSGNAFNLYSMVGMNGNSVNNTAAIFNLIFLLVLQIYVIALYMKNKNRLELLLLASFDVAIVAVFTLKVDYTYLFMSIALLMIYAMISGEKRAFILIGAISTLSFMNVGQLMNQSGFVVANARGLIASFESLDVYLILFSVVTVLTALYYGYVTYSICNNGKKCDIPAMRENLFVTLKNFFKDMKNKGASKRAAKNAGKD